MKDAKVSYHAEFMASGGTPERQKEYFRRLARVCPEVKGLLKRLDKVLDKTIEVCDNNNESDIKYDLLRCRYVLGMD